MKGEGREGKERKTPSPPTTRIQPQPEVKDAIAGDCRARGLSSPLYRKKKGITRPPHHPERPRDPKTRTRRQESSAPYFAQHSDRRLWLGSSGAFNRCVHLPTVQRLIGIYTARNPRTFRHTSSGVVLHVPTLERLSMRAYTRQSRLRYGSQIANNGLRKKPSSSVTPK